MNPEIEKYWDYQKNKNIQPCKITPHSIKSVYWKCLNGHSFKARVSEFLSKKDKCSYCCNKKTDLTNNNLLIFTPEIKEYWSDKNTKQLQNLSPSSNYKAILECSLGHEFRRSIGKIISRNFNCPYCSNHLLLSGFNDLKTKFPSILKHWDYNKNTMDPSQVKFNSTHEYYWVCDNNHSTKQNCRYLNLGFRCLQCSRSSVEYQIHDFLKTLINKKEIATNTRKIISLELDLYVDSLKKAIEVNGDYWHSNELITKRTGMSAEKYHRLKKKLCADKDIDLIFIWEQDWKNSQEYVKENIVKWFHNEKYDIYLFCKYKSSIDYKDQTKN